MRSATVVLLLALAGCANVTTKPTAATAAQASAFAQAQALAANHATLSGQARRDNGAAIEHLLAQLDDAALARDAARLPAGDALYNFVGRALLRRGLPLPHPFDRGDNQFGAANRPAAERDGYRPPLKVGVLLPLSGTQAAVAAAVRDGYLAGYYSENRRRPTLQFYDTAAGVSAAYARAAAEGNDFVVGPLGREDTDAVFADDTPTVPLLALNRGKRTPPQGSAAFSLSPEDEGVSLAHYLLERGSKRVLLIAGNEDSHRRTVAAAKAQLESRGVQIAANLSYNEAMDAALQAQTQIAPDAVLLVLKGAQARSLAPQLAAVKLNKLVLASSLITSGTGKASEDMALDGIIFPTETWLVQPVNGLPSAANAAARVSTAKGPAARLFAFGVDAWRLTAYLDQLAHNPNAEIAGATGRLSLDGFGNVLRRPSWSQFRAGVPVSFGDDRR